MQPQRNSTLELIWRWVKSIIIGLFLGSSSMGLVGLLLAGTLGFWNGLQLGALIGVVGGLLLAAASIEISLLSDYGRRSASNQQKRED